MVRQMASLPHIATDLNLLMLQTAACTESRALNQSLSCSAQFSVVLGTAWCGEDNSDQRDGSSIG